MCSGSDVEDTIIPVKFMILFHSGSQFNHNLSSSIVSFEILVLVYFSPSSATHTHNLPHSSAHLYSQFPPSRMFSYFCRLKSFVTFKVNFKSFHKAYKEETAGMPNPKILYELLVADDTISA